MSLLTLLVTLYGVLGALSSLLQVRRMLRTRSSEDVSLLFIVIYTGGFLVWLVYGFVRSDLALIMVDLVGLVVSLTTLTVALRLRMVERGQGVLEAFRDEASAPPPQLSWLGVDSKPLSRPPAALSKVAFNRVFPLMVLKPGDDRPQIDQLKKLNLPDGRQSQFVDSVISWRLIDSPDCSKDDFQAWRESLSMSFERVSGRPERPAFLNLVLQELLRPSTLPPVAPRLSACRATTLWAACLELPGPAASFAGDASRLGDFYIGKLAHRWAEQALAAGLASTLFSPGAVDEARSALQPLGSLLPSDSPAFLVDSGFAALLWPLGARAGDLFGGPDGAPYPFLSERLLEDPLAVRRAFLLALRPRLNRRRVSPFDRSLNEGFASLAQLLFLERSEPELLSLYPLERGFLSACALRAGVSQSDLLEGMRDTPVEQSALFLADLTGLPAVLLEKIFCDNYAALAGSLLSPPSPSRITAGWMNRFA